MNIVITGAGKGIGYALTQRFLADSAQHRIWVCSRETGMLASLASDARLAVAALDITAATEEAILSGVAAHLESVDILIHNAGQLLNGPFETLTVADWEQLFDINVLAPVRINRALLPLLQKSAGAHVIHIGSMGGVQGSVKFPGLSAYSASKAAIANLSECLAEEWKQYGIHVNCLALGAVNTEMLRTAFPGYQADMESTQIADFIYQFSVHQRPFFNGKILPVTASTP